MPYGVQCVHPAQWGCEAAEWPCGVRGRTGNGGAMLQAQDRGHGQHRLHGARRGLLKDAPVGLRVGRQGSLQGATRSCTRSPQEPQSEAGVQLMEPGISCDTAMPRHRLLSCHQDGAGSSPGL